MATESSTETVTDSTEETSGQDVETQDTTDNTTPEAGGNGESQESSTSQEPAQLPKDHPLVTAYERQKEELKQLRSSGTKVQELETKVSELQAKADASDAIQAKYDRLEAFLVAVGGPLSRALDSKSFTQSLFESDTDIKDLVADWNKNNPSATSQALGSSGSAAEGKVDFNALLRAAAK
ncbi:scaffolding protein [Microbacterium phage Pikmin]|uniref:Scaffolding protein n=2 Tax=Pikminvirus pikmin TaxID=2560596 RepID=A0A2P1CKC3_9CAUD|nr:scaffolding protein [Microbacterium phage Pikmin]AVJ51143.1 scaffolding protein [Microbacterium phage Pikmin]AVJ51701.1 scaffolding protein [Microbacterium phage Casey]